MSEKVISGGCLVPGAFEVEVPSIAEFDQRIDEIKNEIRCIQGEIGRIGEITGLWRAIDQLTQSPNQPAVSQYDREIRKIYNDIRELERNVWREENGSTPLWNFVGGLRGRLDALNDRLPDTLRNTVREAVQAELKPLLGPAATNIEAILDDNRKLRGELDSLRIEIKELKSAMKLCGRP